MIFIKLTLQTNGKSVFVNAEKIIDLFVYEEGKGTAISLNLDVSYHVQESPEEIIEKIRAEEERQNTLIELVSGEPMEFNIPDMQKYLNEKEGFKDLQDIKDEVFQEIGWKGGEITGDEVDAIAERYAKECCKATLNKAKRKLESLAEEGYLFEPWTITQIENIVLL